MFNTQKLSGQIVTQVLDGKNLTQAFAETWKQNDLAPHQRAAIQDICYGTLRQLGLLQAVLSQLLRGPLHENELRNLLLIGLYQLAFTHAAPYAVVDHAVKVATHTGSGRGKGLVNAVLRNFLRQQQVLISKAKQTPVGHYSHPEWWQKLLTDAWPDDWQSVLEANNQHPPMTLRVNRRRQGSADYLAKLTALDIRAQKLDDTAILLHRPTGVSELPGFFDGEVSVQDWGAQHAARLLDVQSGQRVLDACAAPGGKSCHLLELTDIDLLALDNDAERVARIEQNLQRLDLKAQLAVGDASQPSAWWDGRPFDRILADVPCSASGVVRRHPDIKWLRRPEDIRKFAQQQAQILDALWATLAPGGKMLYATCSVFPAENSEQAAQFLSRHSDAVPLPLPGLPQNGQLLPSSEHDGFFYALFCKTP